jgi:hypothetical protein
VNCSSLSLLVTLKTCKFSHGFWPGKAAHRAFKNDFRTADSGRKPHEVYQMVRNNSCELYGKAYDDLTKALTRAKWICRQNDDNLRLQSYRANPNLSFSNFRKRCGGRPKDQRMSHITSFYRFPYKRQVLCLGDKVRQPPLLVTSTRALHGFTGYTLLYTQGLIRLDTDGHIQKHTYT